MFMSDCPARTAIEVIANKWSVVTLYALGDGPKRHSELVALSGGISRKVLTQTLRRLERNGLVDRRRYAEAPPRVEYSLTPLGRTLHEPISMLTEWARAHGEELLDVQEALSADQAG
ncbi:helix-turn-helix transcriptional regulator [Nocardia veterana]|uniref:Helix-turn-helix transcriptional regulator n=2 Tax=Nocardia veterana TaxID=132249 RepID=A0A7X6RH91_9NOCA|nr:helix-turn-helix transcriptional regulator [Nocardia veterana]